MRLRFAGFGGQGVVLCGFIFGKAAMLDGKNSIHTQSYGSASRGGLTKSDVVIEEGEIYDLVHDEVDGRPNVTIAVRSLKSGEVAYWSFDGDLRESVALKQRVEGVLRIPPMPGARIPFFAIPEVPFLDLWTFV